MSFIGLEMNIRKIDEVSTRDLEAEVLSNGLPNKLQRRRTFDQSAP